MGDRLWADKSPQYFTKPARPTQPLTLSETGNEYQPKWSDVLWPGSEGMAYSTSDERVPERLRDDRLIGPNKCCINKAYYSSMLGVFVTCLRNMSLTHNVPNNNLS